MKFSVSLNGSKIMVPIRICIRAYFTDLGRLNTTLGCNDPMQCSCIRWIPSLKHRNDIGTTPSIASLPPAEFDRNFSVDDDERAALISVPWPCIVQDDTLRRKGRHIPTGTKIACAVWCFGKMTFLFLGRAVMFILPVFQTNKRKSRIESR